MQKFRQQIRRCVGLVADYFLPTPYWGLFSVAIGALGLLFTPTSWLFAPQNGLSWLLLAVGLQGLVAGVMKNCKARPYFLWFKNALWLLGAWIYFQQAAVTLLQDYERFSRLPQPLTANFYIEKQFKTTPVPIFLVKVLSPDITPFNAYVRWAVKGALPQTGEWWHGSLQLHPVTARLNFGGFDRQKWFLSQKIIAEGKVKKATKRADTPSWRDRILRKAQKATANLPQQGLLLALAFGERAWLPYDIQSLYQRTNTAHLIAISGLHIGLAMLLGVALMRGVQFFLPTRFISPLLAWIGGVLLATFYASLAGFAPPTFRALVAILVVSFLHFGRVNLNAWLTFCFVVALLLCVAPLMVLSTSFWLSVSAVASLLLWYRNFPLPKWQSVRAYWFFLTKRKEISIRAVPVKRPLWRQNLRRILQALGRFFFALLHLQLGLFLLLTPVQLWVFGGSSWAALVANVLIVPLFSLIVIPLVLLATLITILPNAVFAPLQGQLWRWANGLLEWGNHLLSGFSDYWFPLSQGQMLWATLLLWSIFAGILWLRWQYRTGSPLLKSKQWAWLALFCLFALILASWQQWGRTRWRVTMLDVGQGLAVLIEKNGQALLYDTGVSWRFPTKNGTVAGSMAEREILPYLQRQGLRLNEIILSHDDRDHSGGMTFLLQKFQRTLWRSASLKTYNRQLPKPCVAGESWQWQGLRFQILSPKVVVKRAKNEHSCVVLVQDQKHSLLLLGDATAHVERAITPALQQLLGGKPLTLLQVAHHGSATSSTLEFLRKFRPTLAWISASRWNMWGLPKSAVVKRLRATGAKVANTGEQGALRFSFGSGRFEQARSGYSAWYQSVLLPQKLP